jgi:MSHA biogenesis protein MshN
MSVINQMLRELDARGAVVNEAPVVHARLPVKDNHLGLPVAAGLLLVAGGVGYWMLTGASDKPKPSALAVPVIQKAIPAMRVVAPPVEKLVLHPLRVEPAGVIEKSKLSAVPRIQMATSLPIDTPLTALKPEPSSQQPTVVPAQSQAESVEIKKSTVIKNLAVLTPEAEAQQLYEDAQTLRRAGKSEAAIGKLQQALERDPGMRPARLQLAGLLQASGQPDAALRVLKAGYEQQPNDTLAIAVGRLLADQGQRDEALIWLERGRAGLRPADFALMGALLSQTQRFDESARAYQRALAADPDQGGWLLGLGLAQEALGRMDEARATYRKALEHGEFKPEVIEFLQKKTGKQGL